MKEFEEVAYPPHKSPHGVLTTIPDDSRVWVCTECCHVFSDDELRHDMAWGHPCQQHPQRKGQRCESHLEPFKPEVSHD